jgi:hypothetical protein
MLCSAPWYANVVVGAQRPCRRDDDGRPADSPVDKKDHRRHDQYPLESHIRSIPDFPIPGIQFEDITTLLRNGTALHQAIDVFVGALSQPKH